MASAAEVRAALDALPAVETALRDYLAALTPPPEEAGHAESQVTATGTADGTITPPDPAAWPSAGTWPEKIDWVQAQAGLKAVERRTVDAGYAPPGCRLQSGILYIDDVDLVEDIEYAGQIRPSERSTKPVTLRNVFAFDVFTGSSDTASRVALVEDCEFNTVSSPTASWGSGSLNGPKPGFVVRRTLIQGGVDGVQCLGGGTFEDSVIRSLTVTSTSHNDFCQNYGGLVAMRRCYLEQLNVPANHLNGLFCDGGTYDLEDCAVVVTAAPGTNAWALHAGKYSTPDQIRMRRCYVRGRKVGQVTFESDVDWQAGY